MGGGGCAAIPLERHRKEKGGREVERHCWIVPSSRGWGKRRRRDGPTRQDEVCRELRRGKKGGGGRIARGLERKTGEKGDQRERRLINLMLRFCTTEEKGEGGGRVPFSHTQKEHDVKRKEFFSLFFYP